MGRRNQATSKPFGRPLELPGALGELARAAGGTGPLADLLGISPRTLQRWGKTPPAKRSRMLLERVAADLNLPARVRKQLASFAFASASPARPEPT
jgi:hypothetical protein